MYRKTAYNISYKKLPVQWLNKALCFVSSSVVANSFRLRNCQLLVIAKHYVQLKQINNMRDKIKIFTLSFMLFSITVFGQSNRRQLIVSLYPFIPNSDNFYRKIELEFEKQNHDIDLIVNLNADYYDESTGLISEEADVYELDCILLKDFVQKEKSKVYNPTNSYSKKMI
ncbi:MAG: hypothetical protein IPH93_16505 [Saprospiraceae bacterium]|nr:hypothetical protein [Saprospiraceae bacterium]